MKKTSITISFDEEKLSALKMYHSTKTTRTAPSCIQARS